MVAGGIVTVVVVVRVAKEDRLSRKSTFVCVLGGGMVVTMRWLEWQWL